MAYPWEGKLAELGLDDEATAKVNALLSGTVQPYITQLEQNRPPEEAAQLYADFASDPLGTFKDITEELIEQNVLTPEALTELFSVPDDNTPPPGDEPAAPNPEAVVEALRAAGLDPDAIKAASEITLSAEANREYDEVVNGLVEANPEFFKHPTDPDRDVRSWIDPYIVSAENADPQAALESYKAWYTDCFGDPTAEPAGDPPPSTVGDEAAAPGTETAKRYTGPDGLDNAIDDYFAETRAAEPPAVGSV